MHRRDAHRFGASAAAPRQTRCRFEYSSGVPRAVAQFEGSAPHGRWTFFHPNGKKAAEGDYSNGVEHGRWVGWYQSGTKWFELGWEQGRQHGPFTLWFEDGKVQATGAFHHGEPVGRWERHASSGGVAQVKQFPAAR